MEEMIEVEVKKELAEHGEGKDMKEEMDNKKKS